MTTNFIKHVVPQDFNVELIAESQTSGLYMALRDKVWHFVACSLEGTLAANNSSSINIQQWHLPRYLVAEAMSNIVSQVNFDVSPLTDLFSSYELTSHFRALDVLTPNVLDFLATDVSQFQAAQAAIAFDGTNFQLPDEVTYNGNEIESKGARLVQAIAFERELKGELDASDFELFSAYCTYRDFILAEGVFDAERVVGLVQGQLDFAPEQVAESYQEIARAIQLRTIQEPIWGVDVRVGFEAACERVQRYFDSQSYVKRAQFVLMSGMHNDGLFLPLGVIGDVISFETYLEVQTEGMAPDSDEEQNMRTETAFIRLLGLLID